MRVLVTGAQGCIGAWVTLKLLERGAEVISFDRDAEPARLSLIASPDVLSRVRFETGAIQDTARVKAVVREEGVTHIVHLAAVLMPYCQANPVDGAMINVVGTLNVFEAARDAGRPVRVVYASSAAVWGPGEAYEDRALTENDPLKPALFYGIYKQSNEACAAVFYRSSGISSMGLRPWTVYGVGRDRGMTADPTFALRAAALRKPYQIRLTGPMDLQYVEDVAESFVRCLLSDVEGAHVFNLAGDIISMEALIAAIEAIRPEAKGLLTCAGPQVPVAVRMDDSALRALVPAIPRTPLSAGLRKTIDAFEKLAAAGRISGIL
jgi:nucleoside-diphosphate-sugar epimerase